MIEGGWKNVFFFVMEGLHNQVLEYGFMLYFVLLQNLALSPV